MTATMTKMLGTINWVSARYATSYQCKWSGASGMSNSAMLSVISGCWSTCMLIHAAVSDGHLCRECCAVCSGW